MLQFNEKVDIKGEDNIIQYRVTAKVKVSEDKKLNSGNEQGNKKISKKGMIGKAIGFTPLVCVFVGYLIMPLVFIGLTSMSTSFSTMSKMKM